MKKKGIDARFDHEADEILSLLDELPTIQARPEFPDRLIHRMQREEAARAQKSGAGLIIERFRLVTASALLAGAVMFGIFVGRGIPASNDTDGIETLISTYGISVPENPGYFSIGSD